jgi:hypothetical protein
VPDFTLTLDVLDEVRMLYALANVIPHRGRKRLTPERLWRIEKYLVHRLERAGLAAPPDLINDDLAIGAEDADPTDEYDYLHELVQPDFGGSD